MEQRMSRMEEMMADFQKSTLDFQEKFARGRIEISKQLSELRATMNRSRGDRRTEKSPDDQAHNDEDLVETEVATDPIEIEHGTLNLVPEAQEENKNFENHEGLVMLEEEPISPLQVHVSQLEPSLRFHNASPDVCEDFKSLVGFDGLCDHVKARAELVTKSTSVTNNQAAHQLFDVIPLMTKVLPKEHKTRFHKSWRFKFKDKAQPRELMKGKMGVHEANATRNQLSSVAVGDSQETQWLFNDELKDIRKFQIVIEEGHNSYAFQEFNGISLRSHILQQQKKPSKSPKSWKFKYKVDSEDQLSNSMVKKSGIEILSDRWLSNSICCELETGEIDNDEYRVPSDSDLVVNEVEKVKKELVATEVDGETVSLIDNNQHSEEKVKNRSTNSVLQPSLVPQMCSLLKEQVHEAREENSTFEIHENLVQQVLLEEDSTTHFHEPVSKSENLRKMKANSLLNNREAVVAVVERSRQVCVDKSDGQLFWMVFIREPAIRAVQRIWEKETHDVDIIDTNSVLQEEFEQVVNHTPFSVIKLEGLLLLGDESFQIKHKWRFKLLPLILECELYSDRLMFVTNYAQQFDISGLMILMTVGTLFTNLRSQLLFKALKWLQITWFSSLPNLEVKVSPKEGDLIRN